MNQLRNNDRRFGFSLSGNVNTKFEVVSFEGEEEISTLYRFDLLLVSTDPNIEAKAIVGKQADFSLNDGFGQNNTAIYRGMVKHFTLQHQVNGWTFYRAVLVPKLWKLETYRLSEVYLNKERHEIFRHVMDLAGLTNNEFAFRIKNDGEDIPAWDYICQYQESYLTFISRWSERLGIYWWFEDIDGQEKAVFCNTYAGHTNEAIPLQYQPPGELDANLAQVRRVQKLEQHSQILPRQVVVMDYYHKQGNGELKAAAIVDTDGMGEVFLYGENLRNNDEAMLIAQWRAEGIRCRGEQFQGDSNATGLRCGHFTEVSGHFRSGFNRRFLLTHIKHQGSQAGLLFHQFGFQSAAIHPAASGGDDFYRAEFTAIPSDIQYRPEIRHPWPKIEGALNAFIDGEDNGKYAELNEKGEYKIQVPFDISEKEASRGSTRVRMITPYAGSDHGMHFPLHKRAEVLLSFVNGNPDQPVIIGAVPNPNNPSVVENSNQTMSRIRTSSGNEIAMGDQMGAEHMKFASQGSWMRLGSGKLDPAAQSDAGARGVLLHADGNSTFITTGNSLKHTIGNVVTTTGGDTNTTNYGAYKLINRNGSYIENHPDNAAGLASVIVNYGIGNVTNLGASNVTNMGASAVVNLGVFNGLFNFGGNYMLQIGPSAQHFTFKLIRGDAQINSITNKLESITTKIDDTTVSIEKIQSNIQESAVAVHKIGSAVHKTNTALLDTAFAASHVKLLMARSATEIADQESCIRTVVSEISESRVSVHNGLRKINSVLILE
jgi:type VI secretion system secreted protein VgrG